MIIIRGANEITRELSERAPGRMQVLARQTLNRAATRTRGQFVRVVTSQLNLAANVVRDRTGTRQASGDQLEAAVYAEKRAIQLARFDAKQNYARNAKTHRKLKAKSGKPAKAGISVLVKRGGARQILPGAFFVPLRAGKADAANGQGVAIRRGKNRYPIEVLYGPSPDQLFKRVQPDLRADAESFIAGELNRRAAVTVLGK